MANDPVLKFIFEAGMLKRTARSGWWSENIKHPESVADHSFRAAIIAFILAKMEGENADKVCTAAVFHDMHEARLGDVNKITARYIEVKEDLELKVEKEQVQDMPKDIQDAVLKTRDLSEKERTILKDADYLECAIQAKEYADAGNKGTMRWVATIGQKLKTKNAKALHSRLETQGSNSWWENLKRIE